MGDKSRGMKKETAVRERCEDLKYIRTYCGDEEHEKGKNAKQKHKRGEKGAGGETEAYIVG
ncbi:hypothetical protein E2C01_063703 [Portunus trituberculatus]|uniref:Uncharacterized protein n=1 Tax=Portunus trituberculatus TaxID=210409 RepID=A0A5B7HJR2_PORTR|nr:hypothetical protein [Portunus trituberculatus]